MPWPHTNEDGLAIKGHDKEGKKKPDVTSKEMLDYLIKDAFLAPMKYGKNPNKYWEDMPVVPHKDVWDYYAGYKKPEPILPLQTDTPSDYYKKLMGAGLVDKAEYYAKMYGKPDPVVIPATMSYADSYTWKGLDSLTSPVTMKVMELGLRVRGLDIKHDSFGVKVPLSAMTDYKESELRAILMKQFEEMTDKIIGQLKDKK